MGREGLSGPELRMADKLRLQSALPFAYYMREPGTLQAMPCMPAYKTRMQWRLCRVVEKERFTLDNSCTALDSEKYTVDLGVSSKSLSHV